MIIRANITRILSFLLLMPIICFSENVTKERASGLAIQFFSSALQIKNLDLSTEVSNIQTFNRSDIPVLYVVNFRDGGFVVTPTDDHFYPVLAYSIDGSFPDITLPSNIRSWMNWYGDQIMVGLNDPNLCFKDQANLWDDLMDSGKDFWSDPSCVEPLLTSKWNQTEYYNEMCPIDPDGYAGHSPVGCVATALSQLLYYFRFPPVGNGSNSYTPSYGDGIYGEQFVDFGNTWYRWDEMQDQCFESNSAVAELCYHCGVSVNMQYQPGNAGSLTSDVPYTLVNYFNYAPLAYFQDRTELASTTQWQLLLMENQENQRPVIYRSTNGWSGHAYVCDGYQDSVFYHFNWGWAGDFNGYYNIEELIPGGINLTWGQGAVFNIYPDTSQFEYPAYCNGPDVLDSKFGTIEDGSGPDSYLSSTTCSWLIQPEDTTVTNILLDFAFLNTEPGTDIISIFDGTSAEAELLGMYSGSDIPGEIHSSSNAVYITFHSNDENQHMGWKISFYGYSLPFCDDIEVVNDQHGFIEDGSKHLDYAGSTNCSWLIAPVVPAVDSVDRIRIHFDLFSVAPDDTLYVYDGENKTMPLLGKFSGWTQPEEVISSTDKVFLNFKTNGGYNGPGWEISYFSMNPDYCKDTVWLTETSGMIDDGSGVKNYIENTECYWVIDVPDAEFVILDFMEVDLEDYYDHVKIYDMNDLSQFIERVSGHDPYQLITVNSNKVLLKFFTDDRDNFSGWKMGYHTSAPGIENIDVEAMNVYPNPFAHQITISLQNPTHGRSAYEITDLKGKTIVRGFFIDSDKTIDLKNLIRGVYTLKVGFGSEWSYRKIVKH